MFEHYRDLDGHESVVNVSNVEDVLNEVEMYGGRELREIVEKMVAHESLSELSKLESNVRHLMNVKGALEEQTELFNEKMEEMKEVYERLEGELEDVLETIDDLVEEVEELGLELE